MNVVCFIMCFWMFLFGLALVWNDLSDFWRK